MFGVISSFSNAVNYNIIFPSDFRQRTMEWPDIMEVPQFLASV
jgi:hypothetical protein